MQGNPLVPVVLQAWRPGTVNGLGFPGPGADTSAVRPQVRGQFGRCHDLAGHYWTPDISSFITCSRSFVHSPSTWNDIPGRTKGNGRSGANLLTILDI